MKIVTGDKYDYFNISEKNTVWYWYRFKYGYLKKKTDTNFWHIKTKQKSSEQNEITVGEVQTHLNFGINF